MCGVFEIAMSSILLVSKSLAFHILHTRVPALKDVIFLGEEMFDVSSWNVSLRHETTWKYCSLVGLEEYRRILMNADCC